MCRCDIRGVAAHNLLRNALGVGLRLGDRDAGLEARDHMKIPVPGASRRNLSGVRLMGTQNSVRIGARESGETRNRAA